QSGRSFDRIREACYLRRGLTVVEASPISRTSPYVQITSSGRALGLTGSATHRGQQANFGVFRHVLDDALCRLFIVDEHGNGGVNAALEHEGLLDAGTLGFEEIDRLAKTTATGKLDLHALAAAA